MPRTRFEWKLRTQTLQMGERTLLVGVLNVTPDSFSDGGRYEDPDRAFARAVELEEEGADIIDVGAESTRPGATRISEAEELRRLVPVLKRLRNKLSVPLSVDTYKSAVAEKALELSGAGSVSESTRGAAAVTPVRPAPRSIRTAACCWRWARRISAPAPGPS